MKVLLRKFIGFALLVSLVLFLNACGEKDTREFIREDNMKYYETFTSDEFDVYQTDQNVFLSEIEVFYEDEEYSYSFNNIRHNTYRIMISEEVYTILEILEEELLSYEQLRESEVVYLHRELRVANFDLLSPTYFGRTSYEVTDYFINGINIYQKDLGNCSVILPLNIYVNKDYYYRYSISLACIEDPLFYVKVEEDYFNLNQAVHMELFTDEDVLEDLISHLEIDYVKYGLYTK